MRLDVRGVVSYNLWRENKAEAVAADVTYLLGRPDVHLICFQEGAGWFGLVRKLVEATQGTWEMAEPVGNERGAKQNIVLWRTRDFDLKSLRFVDLPEATTGVPDRWVTRCRFCVSGSEEQIVVLATHLHSHVENPSWWRLPRQLDYRRDLDILRAMAANVRHDRVVLAVADWNVDQRSRLAGAVPFFPKRMLAKAGMRSNWEALGFTGIHGTHGGRFIDAIFKRPTAWMHFKDQQTIKLSSDHKALLVRFTVTHATP
jgi:hypothetical protein